MTDEHFNVPVNNFGRGSIKTTLLHVCNTYLYWLSQFALNKEETFYQPDDINSVVDLTACFLKADEVVVEFLNAFKDPEEIITGYVSLYETNYDFGVLKLFTHVITHEFHHKGQVMSMGRILGYTPPDADILRF
ncbi:DinB family protein [compost metagenome]